MPSLMLAMTLNLIGIFRSKLSDCTDRRNLKYTGIFSVYLSALFAQIEKVEEEENI